MARLIRMDDTGHTTLAEWTAADERSVDAEVAAFREQLDAGFYAVVTEGEGRARCILQTRPCLPWGAEPCPHPDDG